MIERRRNRPPSERELASLADGSLSGSRRARVERAVAASTELQADVAAQRQALHAISDASAERAPGALRARLELARDPRERRSLRRPAWAVGAAAAASMAAAVVLLLAGTPASAPTVASAATLATRPPVMPAGSARSGMLEWPYAVGLRFPSWARQFGFTAVGARTDRVSGRVATTVYYARYPNLVAYTIVSGRPLLAGAQTHKWAWDGVELWSFRSHGRAVVTWERSGHTCVLSGSPALLKQLLTLAGSEPKYRS